MIKIIKDERKLDSSDICVRCGYYRHDQYVGCTSWGKSWSKHLYPKKIKVPNITKLALVTMAYNEAGLVSQLLGMNKVERQDLADKLVSYYLHE